MALNIQELESALDNIIQRQIHVLEEQMWGTPEVKKAPRFPSGGFTSEIERLTGEPFWIPAREETQASAAEIHAALDAAADEETKRAERILEYRQMYPSNPFLTKDQVKTLCLKYNLVMAPSFMFAGEVPEKNRAERAAFRLHDKHVEVSLDDNELATQIFAHARRAYADRCVLETEVRAPDNPTAPWVMVVSSDLALVCPKGFMSLRILFEALYFNHFADWAAFENIIPVVRTTKGFVRLHGRMIQHLDVEFRREEHFVNNWMWGRGFDTIIRCHFTLPQSSGMRNFTYEKDVFQMMICPPDMLHQNMPIEAKGGWECVFSRSLASPSGRGADPIILQPVSDGYLVVTKWDAEANLPEVAGQTN